MTGIGDGAHDSAQADDGVGSRPEGVYVSSSVPLLRTHHHIAVSPYRRDAATPFRSREVHPANRTPYIPHSRTTCSVWRGQVGGHVRFGLWIILRSTFSSARNARQPSGFSRLSGMTARPLSPAAPAKPS